MRGTQLRRDIPAPVAAGAEPLAPKARPKFRGWIWLLIGAAVVAGAVQWGRHAAHRNRIDPGATIRTARLHIGPLERTLRLTGMAVAEKAAILTAPRLLGNRMDGDYTQNLQELVPNGVMVRKGDKVAEFDRQYMRLQLDDYEAVVAQGERYLKVLDGRLDVTRTAHMRKIAQAKGAWEKALLNLKTAPVRSAIKIEKFRLAAEEMKSRYDEYLLQAIYLDSSEGSAVRRMQLDLQAWRLRTKRIRDNVEKMVIRAPIDGLVVISTVVRGSDTGVIQAGDRMYPGQALMQIVDSQSMVIDASVNQVDAEAIRVGEKAHIRLDAFPDIDLPGHVVSIGAFAKMGSYRRSFLSEVPVRLKFDEVDSRVIPNLSASAEVVLEERENATVIPKECLFDELGDQKHIAFVHNGNHWDRREVEIGLQNSVVAEVISGLRNGEEVAAERVPAELLAAR